MNGNNLRAWLRISLLNLAAVALYGMLMRYKIAFDFPFFEQKNLLHAHSHFAFSGWISHVLYCGLLTAVSGYLTEAASKIFSRLIAINLFCAFGMLISFTIQGYGAVSIIFSTLSIFTAAGFAYYFMRSLPQLRAAGQFVSWAAAGLLLNVFASAGPFTLAYMMATRNINQELYLASVYYFLHFQYSGWFFFGALAIVVSHLPKHAPALGKHFRIFAVTVFPTFFLSVLWAKLPLWLYIVTVAAAVIQVCAWISLLLKLRPIFTKMQAGIGLKLPVILFYAAALALTIKFLLQAVSAIPSLSKLVFGFRPIVIAYLHLVLLGIYSLFLIGYLFARGIIRQSRFAIIMGFAFVSGVFLNELLLAVQGFAAFYYLPVTYVNEMLFGIAVILMTSASGLFIAQFRLKVKN